ncbi:hypothetical protein OB13_13715, partial [Pontibacter sp. HJ8]
MKAKFYFLSVAVFFISVSAVFAQSGPYKYGKVEEAELLMQAYEKDTSAAAVVLSDYGVSHFQIGNQLKLIFERRTRIKILKKSGYEWANVEVPFYQRGTGREVVSAVKGYTYNLENGKVTKDKLESSAVFEEQQSENWHSKKFTMPNVKEGSVI